MCLKGPRPLLQGYLEDVIVAISNSKFAEKKMNVLKNMPLKSDK